MGVSRDDGYRLGAPKEELGLVFMEKFLLDVLGLASVRIDGERNRTHGDLEVSTGALVEVKRQPIDPVRYAHNFVELFEGVRKAHHKGGFKQVADALSATEEELAECRLKKRDGSVVEVGTLDYASCSIASFLNARAVAYVNPDSGYVSVYPSKVLLALCWDQAQARGLLLGAGNSNDVTYGVLVPYSELTCKCAVSDGLMKVEDDSEPWKVDVPAVLERVARLRSLLQ